MKLVRLQSIDKFAVFNTNDKHSSMHDKVKQTPASMHKIK